jgi:hypothetical protein
MSQATCLIHLVSEQTMQNLLPIMALHPDQVIQIRSAGDRFLSAASHLEMAVREAGIAAHFQTVLLKSDSPDLQEVSRELKALLNTYPGAVVNVTGGTKLMSIGAFLGASEFDDSPLLYCDTQSKQFRSLGKKSLPSELPAFDKTTSRLTVPIVMAAHGKSPGSWRYDDPADKEIDFGAEAFSIRNANFETFAQMEWSRHLRAFFRPDGKHIPNKRGKLEVMAQANILDAFPDEVPPCALRFLKAASEAGLLKSMDDDGFCLSSLPDTGKPQSHVEKIANILDGSWIELFVLHIIRAAAFCADPHWSVEPLKNPKFEEARDFGETDIVFLKWPRGNLHVLSCKTTLTKPLEHIESLHERSQNLGGRFARAMLYVLHVRDDQRGEIMRWGRLLNVKILIGDEIFSEFGVDPKRYA